MVSPGRLSLPQNTEPSIIPLSCLMVRVHWRLRRDGTPEAGLFGHCPRAQTVGDCFSGPDTHGKQGALCFSLYFRGVQWELAP